MLLFLNIYIRIIGDSSIKKLHMHRSTSNTTPPPSSPITRCMFTIDVYIILYSHDERLWWKDDVEEFLLFLFVAILVLCICLGFGLAVEPWLSAVPTLRLDSGEFSITSVFSSIRNNSCVKVICTNATFYLW